MSKVYELEKEALTACGNEAYALIRTSAVNHRAWHFQVGFAPLGLSLRGFVAAFRASRIGLLDACFDHKYIGSPATNPKWMLALWSTVKVCGDRLLMDTGSCVFTSERSIFPHPPSKCA